MTRWIAVCVDVFDHEIFSGSFDRRSAWLWLIANAAWTDKRVSHKGQPLDLKRGDVLIGRAFLAKTWGWSEQNVRSFISLLRKDEMIKINQSNGHTANVASICNYDVYQAAKKDTSQATNQSPTSAQPEPNQTLTYTTTLPNSVCESGLAARDGEVSIGMGVFVNCETIRHQDFVISLPAIDQQCLGNIPMSEIKIFASGLALQWATEISIGKKPRDVVPAHIANFIRGSIQSQRTNAEIGERRKASPGRGRQPTAREQRSAEAKQLLQWVKDGGLPQ